MFTITPPVAVDADQVWVFVTADTGAVDAARMAHIPGSDCFIAFPVEAINPTGLVPTYQATGEVVAGFRWASASDIEHHAELFGAT